MKIIINLKRYDTDTATEIGAWDNHASRNDFRWCSEKLYKTPNGAYFLHLQGGPMSEHAEVIPGARRGNSRLQVISTDEAIGWLEKRELAEQLEKEFPDRILNA